MPEDGLTESNVAVLADEGRQVELAVPVARLARLAGMLASSDGTVTGHVALEREQGRAIAEVRFAATLTVTCQRCLAPMSLELEGGSRVVLLEREEDAAGVPQEFETALAPNGRLPLAGLLEEELLLALPAAPRHAAGQCPAAWPVMRDEDAAPEVQRPFAQLGELLAGRSKH
jgi:uncharacterized protein